MSQKLLAHMRSYVNVSDTDFKKIAVYVEPITLGRKQTLVNVGDFCEHLYFVEDGCLNMYFINEKGVNQTAQFAITNWWISDFLAFTKGHKTEFSIQAVEDS